jgi:prevent-host-death family protein
MILVGVTEFKKSLSSYVRRAQNGEIIVITNRGKPVAKIVPMWWERDSKR